MRHESDYLQGGGLKDNGCFIYSTGYAVATHVRSSNDYVSSQCF